ncbi:hypothetical protein L3073_00115 [Ancylomarina sp. DW003]|nr:hypothetical protein [Ancylomarina sp. DW003]MDE5420606.1 hypothetical protein [Ancylomarina sp. DW003]
MCEIKFKTDNAILALLLKQQEIEEVKQEVGLVPKGDEYETHAGEFFTTDDLITLRDKAVDGLEPGELTGLVAKNYDGINDGQLGFDADGNARVGDIGSTQVIATREDSPLSNGIAYYDNTTREFKTKTESSLSAGQADNANELGGISASNYARTDVNESFNGNVGIGVENPNYYGYDAKLHIKGSGATTTDRTGLILQNSANTGAASLAVVNGSNDAAFFQVTGRGYYGGAQAAFFTKDLDISFGTNGQNTETGGTNDITFGAGGWSLSNYFVRFSHLHHVNIFKNNSKLTFGASNNASIRYDGSDMVFNSREAGTGDFVFDEGLIKTLSHGTAANWKAAHDYAVADNAGKLGGIVAANYYHSGNANKSDVDWTVKDLSVAGSITALGGNSSQWNTAYSWGNHSGLYSLLNHGHAIADVTGLQTALNGKVDDSQVLTNVPAGAVFTDTVYTLPFTNNSANWNTAYGWGDHSFEGYLKSADLSGYATLVGDNTWGNGQYIMGNMPSIGVSSDSPSFRLGSPFNSPTRGQQYSTWELRTKTSRELIFAFNDSYFDGSTYNDKIKFSPSGDIDITGKFKINGVELNLSGPDLTNYYHQGNFTDNSSNWNTAYGWGNHANAGYASSSHSHSYLSLSGGILDNGTNTSLTIKCDDAGEAVLSLRGDSQGTGRLFVGQSSTYGGGMMYNGDATPAYAGSLADYITLYRVSAGVPEWTARNAQSSNDWEFRGKVIASGGNSSNWNTAYGWGNHADGGYAAAHSHPYLSTSGGTLTGKLLSPRISLNRVSNVASGYNYYSETLNTWQTYMTPGGTANVGYNGNFTATAGDIVSSWAIRSVIEPVANYGWIWETLPNAGTGSTSIVAQLRSDNGNFKTIGTVTASSFIGNASTATKLANINTSFSGTYPMTVNVNGTIYSEAAVTFNGTSNTITTSAFSTPGGNSSNWNTAYGWGNHAGLYASISHEHDRVYITDSRGSVRLPSYYDDRYVQWDFQNKADTGAGDESWHAIQTISKWSSYDSSHQQEQLVFTGANIKHRIATSDSAWGSWRTLAYTDHTHSYLPLSGKAADADKLDGVSSGSFLRSDATDYLNATLYVRGDIRNETGYRDHGVYGHYDSYKTNHIWSMGSAYRNAADGSNFGNLYGLAYKHTNNTTGGTMGGGHQMVWCQNGSGTSAIGTNIWTSGIVYEYNQALSDRYAAKSHTHSYASVNHTHDFDGDYADIYHIHPSLGLPGTSNLNTTDQPNAFMGWHQFSSATGTPSGISRGTVRTNVSTNGTYVSQFAIGDNTKMAVRGSTNSGSSWTSWYKVYTSLDKPTYSEIGAAAANHTHSYASTSHSHSTYLPKSGGTMTGNIQMHDHDIKTIGHLHFDGQNDAITMKQGSFTSTTDGEQTITVSGVNKIWMVSCVGNGSYYLRCWPKGGNRFVVDRHNSIGGSPNIEYMVWAT